MHVISGGEPFAAGPAGIKAGSLPVSRENLNAKLVQPPNMKNYDADMDQIDLSPAEREFLKRYDVNGLKCNDLWFLMDQVWDECGCDYSDGGADNIARFYAHPIWLLNGLFSESDHESNLHRDSIAKWVSGLQPNRVADFGGGFGSLGRKIADYCPKTTVQIVEPYPRPLALSLAQQFPNLSYAPELPKDADVVIAQDVLEHVTDPLRVFGDLVQATRVGGHIVTANCFFPVIKCHLPVTFHFRYTFRFVAAALGCDYAGRIPGAEHAQIFRRNGKALNWPRARQYERVSRLVFPVLEKVQPMLKLLGA